MDALGESLARGRCSINERYYCCHYYYYCLQKWGLPFRFTKAHRPLLPFLPSSGLTFAMKQIVIEKLVSTEVLGHLAFRVPVFQGPPSTPPSCPFTSLQLAGCPLTVLTLPSDSTPRFWVPLGEVGSGFSEERFNSVAVMSLWHYFSLGPSCRDQNE